jgi:hypothetical protein
MDCSYLIAIQRYLGVGLADVMTAADRLNVAGTIVPLGGTASTLL